MGALSYFFERWSLSFWRIVKTPVGVPWPGFPVLTVATPMRMPFR
jgi:hypothetical protein